MVIIIFDKYIYRFCINVLKYMFLNVNNKRKIKRDLKKIFKIFNINKKIIGLFILDLDDIKKLLNLDLDMFLVSDPSIKSKEEVIFSSPCLFAVMVYRIANYFNKLNVSIFPKILSEFAHFKTGIDIHPNATIGHHFFIDHGTGIVIGETCVIGNYVKIYQGVTLGAISLEKGYLMKNKKRHPTILNNVIIYANATILGGNTIIGNNSVIGCNTVIFKSVPDNSIIRWC